MLKKISVFLLSLVLMVGFTLTTISPTKVEAATLHNGYVSSKYILINDPFCYSYYGFSSGIVKLDASISTLNVMDSELAAANIIDSLPDGYTFTVSSGRGMLSPPIIGPVSPVSYHITYYK
ncbi:hypothetical protein KTC96_25140 (plasmid) [Clostridium estertheticum]|uniref:hypothetical protein n=1 Tax=Clostridium estertheticum TaxID=238834 RepID=UPI001C7CD0F8|nr:hypothetical protein [Clostridium estertheticum]MBX4262543.1 hypothetical protein [Clostridium estertheticum]WLC73337.1 hypothetical protein KTC96_25140 [Clostridium estertheticum]